MTPTGRLSARGGRRSVFPESQRSFTPSTVFPVVIPHFCCRAVVEWPRATFLLTMTLHSSEKDQAARANCSSAILLVSPFSESEKLESQTRTALLTSKPVSPVNGNRSDRSRCCSYVVVHPTGPPGRAHAEMTEGREDRGHDTSRPSRQRSRSHRGARIDVLRWWRFGRGRRRRRRRDRAARNDRGDR